MFATDNYDNYGDLTLERSYRAPNGAVVKIETPVNETATVTLTTTGTYEFRYKATDKAKNAAGYAEFEVVVYDTTKEMETEALSRIKSPSYDAPLYISSVTPISPPAQSIPNES